MYFECNLVPTPDWPLLRVDRAPGNMRVGPRVAAGHIHVYHHQHVRHTQPVPTAATTTILRGPGRHMNRRALTAQTDHTDTTTPALGAPTERHARGRPIPTAGRGKEW
jgi:hypothetical protein